jgi:hypothetical protein
VSRRAWLTPDAPTSETERCRRISVPDDLLLVAAVTGALLPLTQADNWEESGSMTADEAADIMSTAFEAFVASDCEGETGGGECALPEIDGPVFRINPSTGRWEQLDNGTWVEPTGEYAIPEPDARPEETAEEQKCSAASNAVHALHTLYDGTIDFYDTEVDPLLNQVELAGEIAIAIGSAFGPISAAWMALSGFAWEAFSQALAEIAKDDWTEEFEQELVCILKSNMEITDGVAHFNFGMVNSDLVGFILPVIDEFVRVRWQVWYLLQSIGGQGLDAAGATTAVEGDCSECGNWCVYLTPAALGFQITSANTYYLAGGELRNNGGGWQSIAANVVVDTSQTVITRVGFLLGANGGTNAAFVMGALPSDGPIAGNFQPVGMGNPVYRETDDNAAWASNSDETTVSIYANNYSSGSPLTIYLVRVRGKGQNPFGVGSNC